MQEFPDTDSRLKLVLATSLIGRELRTTLTYSFRIEQFNIIERRYNWKNWTTVSKFYHKPLCFVYITP